MSKKNMKRRAYALEAAVGALSRGIRSSGAESVDVSADELIAYAKFVLEKPEKPVVENLDVLDAGKARDRLQDEAADAGPSSPVGEDPGDAGILIQWAETIRQQDAAREAAREAAALEEAAAETSEKAPGHAIRQGKALGCPECSGLLERRQKREEALKRGREKLKERRASEGTGHGRDPLGSPLDDDELRAVAGTELYPPNDEEPSRDLKIRNRQGEVRSYASGARPDGWTSRPERPWSPRASWTSLEMVRRGPWHVV